MLCLAVFMTVLDATIVNVAVPSMATGLGASVDQILWVINGYLVVNAGLLVTGSRLGDIQGRRRLFAGGLATFVVASALCGLAQDTNQLIAARVLQGTGSAMLTPQSLALLTSIFPPQRRGAAVGIFSSVAGLAAVAGPTFGGVLVSVLTWRWIFFVNVPVGVVTLVATFALVPDLRPARSHRLDAIGVALSTAGVATVVFGLVDGARYDWGTIWGPVTVPDLVGAGVVLLVAFVVWEWFQVEPILPLGLLRRPGYGVMMAVQALTFFGVFGLLFPITLYLQSALGQTPLQAGLTIAPMAVAWMVCAPVAGRLGDRVGGRWIVLAGLVLFGAGILLVALTIASTGSAVALLPSMALVGVGIGIAVGTVTTEAMRHVPPAGAGIAAGLLNTTRQVGSALGSAVIGAVLQAELAGELRTRASAVAGQLPPGVGARFVDGFQRATADGLQVGRGQSGAAPLAGLPDEVARQVQALSFQVFTTGLRAAVVPTLLAAAAGVLAAAIVAVPVGSLVSGRAGRREDRPAPWPLAPVAPAPVTPVVPAAVPLAPAPAPPPVPEPRPVADGNGAGRPPPAPAPATPRPEPAPQPQLTLDQIVTAISLVCSRCGAPGSSRDVRGSVYRCRACMLAIDRDRNAALNLSQVFLRSLPRTASPTGTRATGQSGSPASRAKTSGT